MELNKIYNMDCLEGMKGLVEDEAIDVVVTSPPYNIGVNYNSYSDNKEKEDYLEWFLEITKELKRVLKDNGSFFLNVGGKPSDPLWPLEIALHCAEVFTLQNTIYWIKSISISKKEAGKYPHILQDLSVGHFKPVNSSRFLNNCCEYIFHFTKHGDVEIDKLSIGVEYQDKSNQKRWKSAKEVRDRGNTWFIPYKTIRSSRSHPSTFPVKLPAMCIKLHGLSRTKVVLDPFMGIGATAIACCKLNVNYSGFEVDEEYIKISSEQIALAKKEDEAAEDRVGERESKKPGTEANTAGKGTIGRGEAGEYVVDANRVENKKTAAAKKSYKLVIENLSPEAVEPLFIEVKGIGGFQNLIKKLQRQYSSQEHLLILEYADIEKMLRYSSRYGRGGFQDRLAPIIEKIKSVNDDLRQLTTLKL